MEPLDPSSKYNLNKSTYINLRWIGIFGQFITINVVAFFFDFKFNYILTNIVVFFGGLSNIFLSNYFKQKQLSNTYAFYFLLVDIIQLSLLLYFTGGILNPFSIFLIIPSVFASSNLNLKTNLALIIATLISICILSIFHEDLPAPLNDYKLSNYYYYSIPLGLIIALIFLNYFAISFGNENRLRKDALDRLQDAISKEQELVSLGGQAAAAAHSLGTPLSTIKIISQDLLDQIGKNDNSKKDVELLISQVDRCNDILRKLTINPIVTDDFIGKDLSLSNYINEIVKSFEEFSSKKFSINSEQDSNPIKIVKSIEIVYGLRNFIGNANKFANSKIYISLFSDSEKSEITIEDDGNGFPKEILNKIGDPYISVLKKEENSKSGLGLGIFIGKTLLEKNYAEVNCKNSETRKGAEIKIKWRNIDLTKI